MAAGQGRQRILSAQKAGSGEDSFTTNSLCLAELSADERWPPEGGGQVPSTGSIALSCIGAGSAASSTAAGRC